MKTILFIGGEAHGRRLIDLGAPSMKVSADPARQTLVVEDGKETEVKWIDGYVRVRFDHKGWPAEVMLEATLRPEDIHELTENIEIETP